MNKTYTLTSTDSKGGQRSSWNSGYWDDYSLFATTGAQQIVGGDNSGGKFATYFKFDQTTLSTLSSKTIVSVSLTVTVKSGSIPSSGSTMYAIGLKATSTAGASSGNTAWKRTSSNSAPFTAGYLRNPTSGGGQIIADNTQITVSLGTNLPQYGVVIGPDSSSISSYIELETSGTATLTVVIQLDNTIRIVNNSSLNTYQIYVVENSTLVPYLANIVTNGTLVPYS